MDSVNTSSKILVDYMKPHDIDSYNPDAYKSLGSKNLAPLNKIQGATITEAADGTITSVIHTRTIFVVEPDSYTRTTSTHVKNGDSLKLINEEDVEVFPYEINEKITYKTKEEIEELNS